MRAVDVRVLEALDALTRKLVEERQHRPVVILQRLRRNQLALTLQAESFVAGSDRRPAPPRRPCGHGRTVGLGITEFVSEADFVCVSRERLVRLPGVRRVPGLLALPGVVVMMSSAASYRALAGSPRGSLEALRPVAPVRRGEARRGPGPGGEHASLRLQTKLAIREIICAERGP